MPLVASMTSTAGSVGPPGWAPPPPPAAPPPAAPPPRWRSRRVRPFAVLLGLIVAVGVIVAVSFVARVVIDAQSGPWDTDAGRQMHAGFITGCERSTAGLVDCGCAWDHLTSEPPYDTPDGLMTLLGPVRTALLEQRPDALPPQYVAAFTSCRVARAS